MLVSLQTVACRIVADAQDIAVNCFRLIQGYVILGASPGGSATYFSELTTWHHIAADTLMVTQEILGDALAVCP